jgi:AcrR family transcriptional regulator
MEETRRQIVQAALKLHQTVGPARTTIADVARAAHVQRLTVYRHFPDSEDLFAACRAQTARTLELPDAASWGTVTDPEARLRRGLGETYAFYRRGHVAATNILRDAPLLPARFRVGSVFFEFAERAVDALGPGWGRPAERALLRAAIGHAVDFWTWRSLAFGRGLSDAQAVELMLGMVRQAAHRRRAETKGQARASG